MCRCSGNLAWWKTRSWITSWPTLLASRRNLMKVQRANPGQSASRQKSKPHEPDRRTNKPVPNQTRAEVEASARLALRSQFGFPRLHGGNLGKTFAPMLLLATTACGVEHRNIEGSISMLGFLGL